MSINVELCFRSQISFISYTATAWINKQGTRIQDYRGRVKFYATKIIQHNNCWFYFVCDASKDNFKTPFLSLQSDS